MENSKPAIVDDAYLLRIATVFEIAGRARITVERRGRYWAIARGGYLVLNRAGDWEYEPPVRQCDDAFRARCYWELPHDAVAFARDHLAKYPTGMKVPSGSKQ